MLFVVFTMSVLDYFMAVTNSFSGVNEILLQSFHDNYNCMSKKRTFLLCKPVRRIGSIIWFFFRDVIDMLQKYAYFHYSSRVGNNKCIFMTLSWYSTRTSIFILRCSKTLFTYLQNCKFCLFFFRKYESERKSATCE